MAIELHDPTTYQEYIPTYGGNRARYLAGLDREPTIIALRVPTWAEYQETQGDKPLTDDEWRQRLAKFVGPCTRLRLADGTEIPDGPTLIAHRGRVDGAFFLELDRAVGNAGLLSAGLKKNLPWPLGSSDSAPKTAGTAESAGVAVSIFPPSATATPTPPADSP